VIAANTVGLAADARGAARAACAAGGVRGDQRTVGALLTPAGEHQV
jgi:hypothetical protein